MKGIRKRGITLGSKQREKQESKHENKKEEAIIRSLLSFDPFSTVLPPLVSDTIKYLETNALQEEGLFRIPGFQTQVKEMKEKYDRGEDVNLSEAKSIHTVASLLKYYLSELPEPLLTFELMDCFMLAVDVVVREDRNGHENGIEWALIPTKSCMQLLPPGNRNLLYHLGTFLGKLEANSAKNCMTARNIATCFAPIVVRRELDPTDMASFVAESAKAERFIECLILHYDIIFAAKSEAKPMKKDSVAPMKADPNFVKELERGTMILASNLIKRENTLQKLTGSEADLSEYPKQSKKFSCADESAKINSPRPIPSRPRRAITDLAKVGNAISSPQLGGRRTPPARRKAPPRKEFRESGLLRSAAASEDEEVKQLAQLLLQGKMDDATKLLKNKTTQNTISYEGETNSAGQYHGAGTLVFKNGDVYTGHFINGERTGKAKMKFSNGNVYEGDFVNGLRHGRGIFEDYKGNKYEGQFCQGKRTGQGKLTFAKSQHIYQGKFSNGTPQGFGKTTFSNGDVYEGDHDADERHGFGIFQGVNGGSYEGWYSRGKREGVGYYISANGSIYKGTFKNNAMHGFGIYTFKSGDCYTGQFREGKFEGKGIYCFGAGTVVEGLFSDGQPVESFPIDPDWVKNETRLGTALRKPSHPFTLIFDRKPFSN